jgi:hypothetical protein
MYYNYTVNYTLNLAFIKNNKTKMIKIIPTKKKNHTVSHNIEKQNIGNPNPSHMYEM